MRDHCHIVGNYRRVAHSRCNLGLGYDGNLIVKALKSEFGEVREIPQNTESIYPSLWTDSSSSILSNSLLRAWTVP